MTMTPQGSLSPNRRGVRGAEIIPVLCGHVLVTGQSKPGAVNVSLLEFIDISVWDELDIPANAFGMLSGAKEPTSMLSACITQAEGAVWLVKGGEYARKDY